MVRRAGQRVEEDASIAVLLVLGMCICCIGMLVHSSLYRLHSIHK